MEKCKGPSSPSVPTSLHSWKVYVLFLDPSQIIASFNKLKLSYYIDVHFCLDSNQSRWLVVQNFAIPCVI